MNLNDIFNDELKAINSEIETHYKRVAIITKRIADTLPLTDLMTYKKLCDAFAELSEAYASISSDCLKRSELYRHIYVINKAIENDHAGTMGETNED